MCIFFKCFLIFSSILYNSTNVFISFQVSTPFSDTHSHIFHNGYIPQNPVSLPDPHPSGRHAYIYHNVYIFPYSHPYEKGWLYSKVHKLLPADTSLCRKTCRDSNIPPVWSPGLPFSRKIMSRSHGAVPDVWKGAGFLPPVFRPDRYIHRMPVPPRYRHFSTHRN